MLILFVEYHASFRQSASYMMDQEADMEVVSQASSVAEGRRKMAVGGIDAAVVDVPLCPTRVPPSWSGSCTTRTQPSRFWC